MENKKEDNLLNLVIKKAKKNPVFLSILLLVIIVIVVLLVILFQMIFKKPSNKFLLKEVNHSINDGKIKITYTIKNDRKSAEKLNLIYVDLKNKDDKVIGGYLITVDQEFKANEKQEYTVEREIITKSDIASISLRCPKNVECE